MYTVALLTSTFLALVGARIYERCELARDLLQLGVRKDHIATWVCIAYHESRFDTAARNPSSGDHGLLQISEIYWCGAGKACGLPCSALRDDDISDDVECALSIYEEHTRIQGNGFLAWVVYPHYCKHNAKKYLADCDHSTKDVSYKFEDRARISPILYDSHPNINFTLSNPVQSEFSYSQSDRTVPSFLSIVSLLRGKFEQDFERDYNKNKRVNWAQFKIDNVDELKLPDFNRKPNFNFLEPLTTLISTTSTTTMEPELQYKPVKPWRTIETNQFRRRMMKFKNTPLEEMRNKTIFENSLVVTTPKFVTYFESTTSSSASTRRIIYEKDNSLSNNACCSTVTQSSKATSFTTQKPAKSFTTQRPATFFTTQRPTTSLLVPITEQYYGGLNSSQQIPKKAPEMTETKVKSFWDTFSYLTTQSPKLKQVSFTSKTLETSTVKPYASTIQQLSANRVSPTRTNRPWQTTSYQSTTKGNTQVYNSINLNRITTTQRPKEIFSTTPAVKPFTVTKPIGLTWRTKAWTVRQPQYTQRYTPIKSYVAEYRTERPQNFTWRRGKLWSSDYQNITHFSTARPSITPYTTTEKNIPSTIIPQYSNDGVFKSTNGLSSIVTLSPFSINKLLSQSNSSLITKERQEITERSTPKMTFSIFDIYLNPAKRQQVPNYKVLFSENSASNIKIFSGGTTPAPVNRNNSK